MGSDQTIQMLIFDGNPNGRMMCELSDWNGRVYKVSRTEVSKFEKRNDASHTGIYFLFGVDDDNNPTVYIGEAENIVYRLKQHLSDQNFWNVAVVVISKDNLLNKAHVKYLEHEFYQLAKESSSAIIKNRSVPTRSSVSEYDEAMLRSFIEKTRLLVNTLGYKVFDTLDTDSTTEESAEYLYLKGARGADAIGLQVSGGFAVLKGSHIASSVTPSYSKSLNKKRDFLIQEEIVDDQFKFVKDHVFHSPSTAAAVVLGRNANGLTEWKTESGIILKVIIENG